MMRPDLVGLNGFGRIKLTLSDENCQNWEKLRPLQKIGSGMTVGKISDQKFPTVELGTFCDFE